MPTRCNRGFYCRSYCLLNMFRAPLCPSSGAQEYYTVTAACGISCCGFQVAGLVWSWGLCVRFAGCCSRGQYTQLIKLFIMQTTKLEAAISEQSVARSLLSKYYQYLSRLTTVCMELLVNFNANSITGSQFYQILYDRWIWEETGI